MKVKLNSLISVTPTQVVNVMLSRIGKLNQSHVGYSSLAANFFAKLGRNVSGYMMSFIRVTPKK